MSNDLVSIIMLSREGGKYVRETVESVLAQTYRNWELLFVDDNSKDDTIEQIMPDKIRYNMNLKAIWQFCSYLFWPQWGSKRRRAQDEYEEL